MEKQTALIDDSTETEIIQDENKEAVKDNDEPWDIEDRLYEEWRDERDMKGRTENKTSKMEL